MMMRRALAGLGLALILSACAGGSDRETVSTQAELFNTIRGINTARRDLEARPPTPSRAQLDSRKAGLLEVSFEKRGLVAFLAPYSRRTDPLPGQIVVWRSTDGGQIVQRDGLLISTKGLGNDLASADIAGTQAALRQQHVHQSVNRTHYLRRDDNTQAALALNCTIQTAGHETLTIVERQFSTHRLRETCINGQGQAVNDYWIDNSDGTILKSRQWVGPELGYLSFRLLKK